MAQATGTATSQKMLNNRSYIECDTASRYFFYTTLLNLGVAVIVTGLALIPPLALPIKLTVWPGTWMFIAYFAFVIAGVLGALTWTMIYYLMPRLLRIAQVSRRITIFQLVLYQIGVYGTVVIMGLVPGYTGGTLAIEGFGTFLITRVIEWAVIPVGIFVGLALIATVTGFANIVLSIRPVSSDA